MVYKYLYFKQRHKKDQLYYYCSKRCEIVELCVCRGCLNKEFKEVKKLAAKTPINKISKINKVNKVTKATAIPKKVKLKVW